MGFLWLFSRKCWLSTDTNFSQSCKQGKCSLAHGIMTVHETIWSITVRQIIVTEALCKIRLLSFWKLSWLQPSQCLGLHQFVQKHVSPWSPWMCCHELEHLREQRWIMTPYTGRSFQCDLVWVSMNPEAWRSSNLDPESRKSIIKAKCHALFPLRIIK